MRKVVFPFAPPPPSSSISITLLTSRSPPSRSTTSTLFLLEAHKKKKKSNTLNKNKTSSELFPKGGFVFRRNYRSPKPDSFDFFNFSSNNKKSSTATTTTTTTKDSSNMDQNHPNQLVATSDVRDPNDGMDGGEMPEIFSTRRPMDWKAGVSSGLKNIGKGAIAGAAILVSSPLISASESAKQGGEDLASRIGYGAVGFTKGLAVGAVAGVALPVGGVLTGVYQMGRGLYNTPFSWVESSEGKEWDSHRRVWYVYNLKVEAERLATETEQEYTARMKSGAPPPNQEGSAPAASAAGASSASFSGDQTSSETKLDPNRFVKEREYYDLLGIPTNATSSQIRKAYYLKAKLYHPDKNQSDPEANEKFQAVGTAYQVLSNEDLRKKYDAGGSSGVKDAPVMDSSAIFTVLFGSEKFEGLVGQLHVAMMMENGSDVGDISSLADDEKIAYKQYKREVNIAVELAKRLDEGYVASRVLTSDPTEIANLKKDFLEKSQKEAEELAQTPIGRALLGVLAYVYQEQALKHLGFKHSVAAGMGMTELRRQSHVMSNRVNMLSSMYNAYRAAKKASTEIEKEEKLAAAAAAAASASGSDGSSPSGRKSTPKLSQAKNATTNDDGEQQPGASSSATSNSNEQFNTSSLMAFIDAIWHVSVSDIESTLRVSCRKLFKDSSVAPNWQDARAEGLVVLSEAFASKSETGKSSLEEFKKSIKNDMDAAEKAQVDRETYEAKAKSDQAAREAEAAKLAEERKAEEAKQEEARLADEELKQRSFFEDELREMKPTKLRRILALRGIDASGCVEKEDIVQKIIENQYEVL